MTAQMLSAPLDAVDMSVYLTSPLEIEKICRVCLQIKPEMQVLFDRTCLDQMLQAFTLTKIVEGDGFPKHICKQCVLACSKAYTFKRQLDKADKILKGFVSADFQEQLQENTKSEHELQNENAAYIAEADNLSNDISQDKIEDLGDKNYFGIDPDLLKLNTNYSNNALESEVNTSTIDSLEQESTSSRLHCKLCSLDFNCQFDFKVHKVSKDHLDRAVTECMICNKRCANQSALKRHLNIHMQHTLHKCEICDKTFADRSNLRKHIKKHTGEMRAVEGKPYMCSACGKTFKWASSLWKHMKHHTGKNWHQCPMCPNRYVEKNHLESHMRRHTGEKPFTCATCAKAFHTKSQLQVHQQVHKEQNIHVCEICDKRFAYRYTLRIHMRLHTGERPYSCQICNKTFINSTARSAHMKTHTDVKSFSCNMCERKYTSRTLLKQHTNRIHLRGRMNTCKICNRQFYSLASLRLHRRVHETEPAQEVVEGETLYSCAECGEKFSTTEYLDEHNLQQHGTAVIRLDYCTDKNFEIFNLL